MSLLGWRGLLALYPAIVPSVTVLMNGGRNHLEGCSRKCEGQAPVVVVAGSGRTADILVAALNGTVKDDRASALVASGLLQAVNLEDSEKFVCVLEQILDS